MPEIIATYGARDANSYVTLAEANSIFGTEFIFFDEWELASTPTRERALVASARDIERMNWKGAKIFYFQRLQFPRTPEGASLPWGSWNRADPDPAFFDFLQYDTYIRNQKDRVQYAQCEQALYLLQHGGEPPHRRAYHEGRSGISRGHRFSEAASYVNPPWPLCDRALDALRIYRRRGPRIVRGGNPTGADDWSLT